MSEAAAAAINPHLVSGVQIRKPVSGFEGDFTFAEF
jgi:hypothetical protein